MPIHAIPRFAVPPCRAPRAAALALALAAALATALPAAAQPPAVAATPPGDAASAAVLATAAPEGLYDALGGKPGIARIMNGLVDRAFKDERIGALFKETKPQALKDSLTDQICVLSGGPCRYEGADMKSAHADLPIRKRDFNVLVELLQDAMDEQGIAFAQQSRLLALLAPMHRDIITVR